MEPKSPPLEALKGAELLDAAEKHLEKQGAQDRRMDEIISEEITLEFKLADMRRQLEKRKSAGR